MDPADLRHLRRCVELAGAGLEAGDEPFGSVLVDADGTVLFEDHNHVAGGDETRHPEFEIAKWSATHMTPAARAAATVYTSGEHCPMCAAAHGWVGLGRIVYVSSSAQLTEWRAEMGLAPGPGAPAADPGSGAGRRGGRAGTGAGRANARAASPARVEGRVGIRRRPPCLPGARAAE